MVSSIASLVTFTSAALTAQTRAILESGRPASSAAHFRAERSGWRIINHVAQSLCALLSLPSFLECNILVVSLYTMCFLSLKDRDDSLSSLILDSSIRKKAL
jgi:hypothetical protein